MAQDVAKLSGDAYCTVEGTTAPGKSSIPYAYIFLNILGENPDPWQGRHDNHVN